MKCAARPIPISSKIRAVDSISATVGIVGPVGVWHPSNRDTTQRAERIVGRQELPRTKCWYGETDVIGETDIMVLLLVRSMILLVRSMLRLRVVQYTGDNYTTVYNLFVQLFYAIVMLEVLCISLAITSIWRLIVSVRYK